MYLISFGGAAFDTISLWYRPIKHRQETATILSVSPDFVIIFCEGAKKHMIRYMDVAVLGGQPMVEEL